MESGILLLLVTFITSFWTRNCSLCTAASLRAELNHLHATAIEHLKQIHLKENSAAKRDLEHAMEHSHKQVTVVNTCLCVFLVFAWDLVNILLTTLLIFLCWFAHSSYISSRNKSSWLVSQTCKRSCVPVATASPTWTMRSTPWTRPSTHWPENWSTRGKRCCGFAVKRTIR